MDATSDALLFPGMGPARAGELGRFLVIDHRARRLLGVAEQSLGHSLLDPLATEGEEYTEHTQLAFVLACLAVAERAEQEHGLDPVAVGGASFGQRAAVVRSGALPLAELVWLITRVARQERDYFTRAHQDLVSQFVVRVPDPVLADVLDGFGEYELSGRFDQDVHLVTLRENRLEEFVRRVRAAGGYALTTMRPAAHARALGPLREELAEIFTEFTFADPALPIVSDQDGEPLRTGGAVAGLLLESTVTAVRLPELVGRFSRLGIARILVAGPDHLLHRLPGLTGRFELLRADLRAVLSPAPRPRLSRAVPV